MRKLSTRERVLLAILVVVAVVSGYVLLFSMPLNEKIQTLGQEIMESEDLKTQLESRWSQQQRLFQLTEQLKKQEGDGYCMDSIGRETEDNRTRGFPRNGGIQLYLLSG